MARTITVQLTEAQYEALAGAVADSEVMHEDNTPEATVWFNTTGRALRNAWSKINRAWHARGRS